MKDIIPINSETIKKNEMRLKAYMNGLDNNESINEYIWIKEFDCNGNEHSLLDCNNTLMTELTRFDINKHETIAVICQPKVTNCDPFSVFITEQNSNQIQPKVVAPYFDPNNKGYEYIGCFEIGEEMHIRHWFPLSEEMTPHKCYLKCACEIMRNHSNIMDYYYWRQRQSLG